MATFTFEIRNPIRIWLHSHPKFRIISRAQVQFRVSQNRRRLPLPTPPSPYLLSSGRPKWEKRAYWLSATFACDVEFLNQWKDDEMFNYLTALSQLLNLETLFMEVSRWQCRRLDCLIVTCSTLNTADWRSFFFGGNKISVLWFRWNFCQENFDFAVKQQKYKNPRVCKFPKVCRVLKEEVSR